MRFDAATRARPSSMPSWIFFLGAFTMPSAAYHGLSFIRLALISNRLVAAFIFITFMHFARISTYRYISPHFISVIRLIIMMLFHIDFQYATPAIDFVQSYDIIRIIIGGMPPAAKHYSRPIIPRVTGCALCAFYAAPPHEDSRRRPSMRQGSRPQRMPILYYA